VLYKPIHSFLTSRSNKRLFKPTCYIWKSESVSVFQKACASPDVQNKVAEFLAIEIKSNNNTNVDSIVQSFQFIVHFACSKFLRVKKGSR
jgi:hypothetical protein